MAYNSKYTGEEVEAILDNAIQSTAQTLTEEQKAQARTNLGAVSTAEIGDINSVLDAINGEVI